ncbi:MAG: hypothetical protein GPJ54_08595 [Candidatus Heimdallarchaeota archaeon]|nr:hypothetical protein [Candidatus Heimdallarchaeota archaeon]
MRFRYIVLLILLLSSLNFNQITASKENQSLRNGSEITQIPFNSSQFIIDIINVLEDSAVYEEGKLLGWPFRSQGPFENSERKYRGYNVGMAGIGDFLLSVYNEGYLDAKPILDEIIQHLRDNAVDSLLVGKYWGRFSDEDTAGWTGLRYGNAGIIKFLSRLIKLNYTTGLIDLIEEGFTYLKAMQLEDQSWPMTEDGYITTDSQYGAVGIGNSFLEMYENLGNTTYLQEAIDIGNYLIDNGIWEDDRFLITWTTQTIGSEFDGLIVYGKSAGLAGIMDYFKELFILTENTEYLEIMTGLANTILFNDLGGYWPDGSVSYVSRIHTTNIALTGYDVGSSGIAHSLLGLTEFNNNQELLNASARAEKFVISLINDDFSLPVGLTYQTNKLTGKSLGTAGLALLQLQMYEKFGTERHLDLAINILNHLYSLFESNQKIPLDEADLSFGYSYNLEDGIAGIGEILLFLENVNPGLGGQNYEELYSTAVPNLSLIQASSDESTSSKSAFSLIYTNLLIMFMIRIYSLKLSKYKRNGLKNNNLIN